MGSWRGITAGKVGTQRGPLAVPRERGQAVAASGLLLVAGVIQVTLLRVLGARWHLAVGLGGDWPRRVAGGGQVVSPQPGGCRNGAVMDRADSFPGGATVAGLGVPHLWHGETGLARSCILFFSVRENKGMVKLLHKNSRAVERLRRGIASRQLETLTRLPHNTRCKTSPTICCTKSQSQG